MKFKKVHGKTFLSIMSIFCFVYLVYGPELWPKISIDRVAAIIFAVWFSPGWPNLEYQALK